MTGTPLYLPDMLLALSDDWYTFISTRHVTDVIRRLAHRYIYQTCYWRYQTTGTPL